MVCELNGTIENCFAKGDISVSKNSYAGIFLYGNGTFNRCYAAVDFKWTPKPPVFDLLIGGVYGRYNNANAKGYYDSSLFDKAFDGIDPESISITPESFENLVSDIKAKGIGLPTAEMKKMASFDGWDFNTVWGRRNDINDGYPYLRWTHPGLDNDSDLSGIDGAVSGRPSPVTDWYTVDGVRIPAAPTVPGIYIVRRADGTTGKVLLR